MQPQKLLTEHASGTDRFLENFISFKRRVCVRVRAGACVSFYILF